MVEQRFVGVSPGRDTKGDRVQRGGGGVKASILLVEDSASQARVAQDSLEESGYRVIWVDTGKAAIKTAKTEPVDLILLDVVLPDMGGTEVCRWLKVDPQTRGVPIIMLTVRDTVNDKVTGLESGADDYLAKPYNETELNARIYACLRTKGLQDELRDKNRQLEKLLAHVEYLAITDPLTELYNRRRFETVLNEEFKRAKRYDSAVSLLLIDVDRFKRINDGFGHQVGDAVLREVAMTLKNCVREVDTCARWGGEEFIVLCHQTGRNEAVQAAERIRRAIGELRLAAIPDERISVSIGIASIPENASDSTDKLLNHADLALYEAKESGRDRVVLAE